MNTEIFIQPMVTALVERFALTWGFLLPFLNNLQSIYGDKFADENL